MPQWIKAFVVTTGDPNLWDSLVGRRKLSSASCPHNSIHIHLP